jgi:DNA processing protein
MSDIFNKLLILRTPGVGPVKYKKLIEDFGSADQVIKMMGVAPELYDAVARELDLAVSKNIHYITDDDDLYPFGLRQMKNHPPIISVRGNINALKKNMVSIVGTRHATAVGMEFVADIAQRFADNNIVVVSGMAIGTDTAAHYGALRVNADTVTIAVLAGGVDYIWPVENESLYAQIMERGAIISEMPVGYVPVATNFVQRNKLIAGLGEKLILGEADLKSGSMTTARFAIEMQREVWAIPSHPADLRATGPNSLIRNGQAQLCMGADDFFAEEKKQIKKSKKVNAENNLIDVLGTIPVSESVLAELVKKTVSEIKSELVVLELQGFVRKVDGGYIRA